MRLKSVFYCKIRSRRLNRKASELRPAGKVNARHIIQMQMIVATKYVE